MKTQSEIQDKRIKGRNVMRSSYPVWVLVFLAVISVNGLANIDQGIAAYEQENYAEAHRILNPLADANQPEALHHMGNMYYRGFGVAKDQAKAVAYWRNAAELGYADSAFNLGIAHKNLGNFEVIARC